MEEEETLLGGQKPAGDLCKLPGCQDMKKWSPRMFAMMPLKHQQAAFVPSPVVTWTTFNHAPFLSKSFCHHPSHTSWRAYYTVLGTCNQWQLPKVKGRDGTKESEQRLLQLTHGKGEEWMNEWMSLTFIEHLLWARNVQALYIYPLIWSPQFYQVGPVIIPALQMKKLRHGEMTLPKGT